MRTGLASNALCITAVTGAFVVQGTPSHAATSQEIKQAELGLEQAIQSGRSVPVDMYHNVLQRVDPKANGPYDANFDSKYRKPLAQYVDGKFRYFELIPRGDRLKDIDVKILPHDVAPVVAENIHYETPIPADPTVSKVVRMNKSGEPVIKNSSAGRFIPVGSLDPGPYTYVAAYSQSGRRYADQSMAADLEDATSLAQAEKVLETFGKQYNVRFSLLDGVEGPSRVDDFNFTRVTKDDLKTIKDIGAVVMDEWSKLPLELFWMSAVKNVYFSKTNDIVQDESIENRQPSIVSGAANPGQGWITFPVHTLALKNSTENVRRVVHHEVEHTLPINEEEEAAWVSLNTLPYKKVEGVNCLTDSNKCTWGEHPETGFVTGYARSSAGEDTAEVFSYIMTASMTPRLKKISDADPIVRAKVTQTKQRMQLLSAGIMNASYYRAINPPPSVP